MVYMFFVRVFFLMCSFLWSWSTWAGVHHPQDFLAQVAGTPNEGAQIVQHYCASCHAAEPLIPLGAPRLQETSDWTPRLKQGLDSLFQHVNEGLNAMPPRGGCFECSDQQLWRAIEAMMPEKERKRLFLIKKNAYQSIR